MAYTSVSYGSRGNDVTELQKKLNENGYNLKEDGIFGNATRTAVQDYQRKNSLKVDGIAGNETWGSLIKSSAATTAPAVQAQQTPQYSASYDAQLDSLFQKIMNREKFSYDANEDAIYQQYRDLYMQQGQQAMQDTMGQAAGLTGGYGSTYSQNAGQQAYNAYLQQLNGVVPELAGAAADRYAQEGDALYQEYAMLGDLRDTEYGRYQDQLDRYWREKEFAYQQERDKVEDERWAKEFAEAQRQYNASLAASRSELYSGVNPVVENDEEYVRSPGATTSDATESAGGYAGAGFAENSTVVRQVLALFDQNTPAADAKAINMLEAVSGKLSADQKKSITTYLSQMGYDIEW